MIMTNKPPEKSEFEDMVDKLVQLHTRCHLHGTKELHNSYQETRASFIEKWGPKNFNRPRAEVE